MKKAILFVAALILLSFISNATNNDRGKTKLKGANTEHCFDENSHLINVGIGLGGFNYYRGYRGSGYSYRSTPLFSVSYEQAWPKKLGPGYLGVGGYLAFRHTSSRYNNYWYQNDYYYREHNWNSYVLAARGVYHWDVLNAKNAEVYGGVLIGLRISTYSYKTNSPDPDAKNYEYNDGNVGPVYSIFAGARWYFIPKMALFAEAGYGISYLNGGLTFKF